MEYTKEEKHICKICEKEFVIRWIEYPSKLDDARISYYFCPYCKDPQSYVNVHLRGNEELETFAVTD